MNGEQPNAQNAAGKRIDGLKRSADFVTRYANNVQLEASSFDLKLIFGILDQSEGASVEQHTAMCLSWSEVKLLIYFLQLNLAGFERMNGPVVLPLGDLPPEPPKSPPAHLDNPEGRAALEHIRRMRESFVASLRKVSE